MWVLILIHIFHLNTRSFKNQNLFTGKTDRLLNPQKAVKKPTVNFNDLKADACEM